MLPVAPALQPIIHKDRSALPPLRTTPLPSPRFTENTTPSPQQTNLTSYFSPISPTLNQNWPPTPSGILLNSTKSPFDLYAVASDPTNGINSASNMSKPTITSAGVGVAGTGGVGAALWRAGSPDGGQLSESNSEGYSSSNTTNTSTAPSSNLGSPALIAKDASRPNTTSSISGIALAGKTITRPTSPTDSLATLTIQSAPTSPEGTRAAAVLTTAVTSTEVKHCTFAPLPKVEPLTRRNSIALGAIARHKALGDSQEADEPFSLDLHSSSDSEEEILLSASQQPLALPHSLSRSRSHSPSPNSSRCSSLSRGSSFTHVNPHHNSPPPSNSIKLPTGGAGGSGQTSRTHSPSISRRSSIDNNLSLHFIQGGKMLKEGRDRGASTSRDRGDLVGFENKARDSAIYSALGGTGGSGSSTPLTKDEGTKLAFEVPPSVGGNNVEEEIEEKDEDEEEEDEEDDDEDEEDNEDDQEEEEDEEREREEGEEEEEAEAQLEAERKTGKGAAIEVIRWRSDKSQQ